MSRGGIQGFQKERLSQVLLARRLSQVQLAAMVGVSPATISKWRSGGQMPEREGLERLAAVVNVSPEWFTRPVPAKPTPPLFRSNASAHVAARAMLGARLEWAQELAIAMAEFVDYPTLNLPGIEVRQPEAITNEDIERAAQACRERWRLGRAPIQDLALAAEGAGVILVREETGAPQIEGLSAWSEALGRPFVLLSADKANGYRSRFDLAHELGHLVLHRHVQVLGDCHKLMEEQAHRFAGALLLPAESLASEVRLPATLDDLLLLKRRWGVSVAAIVMRLHALQLLGDEERLQLFKRRSARWGAKAEPGDGGLEPERPRLLRRTIEMLIDEGVLVREGLPAFFGLAQVDIQMLAGLPEGYFDGRGQVLPMLTPLRSQGPARAPRAGNAEQGVAVLPFRRRSGA